MFPGGVGRFLLLATLLVGACAPRAVERGQVSVGDSGPDEREPDQSDQPDAAPAPDAAPVARDGAAREVARAPEVAAPVPDASADGPPVKNALLVVANPMALPTDDVKLQMRLAGRGFTVKIADDDGEATAAQGMDLVVLSGTGASTALGAKYLMVAVPIIVLEPNIYGQMKMTGTAKATDFDQGAANQVTIVVPDHPLAGGQKMTVAVASAGAVMTWGVPAMTADRVATVSGSTTHWAVFAYDAGKMMVGLAAPGRRLGLFIANSTADRLTAAGWQIFDAAVDWAVRP
jgi:hypothetical protein